MSTFDLVKLTGFNPGMLALGPSFASLTFDSIELFGFDSEATSRFGSAELIGCAPAASSLGAKDSLESTEWVFALDSMLVVFGAFGLAKAMAAQCWRYPLIGRPLPAGCVTRD